MPGGKFVEDDVVSLAVELHVVRRAAHPSVGGIFLGYQTFTVWIHDTVYLLPVRLVDFSPVGLLEDAFIEVVAVSVFF